MKPAKIDCAFVLPVALLLVATASAAGLQPYSATYEVARNGGALGSATVTLRQTPNGWSYDSQTRGTSGLAALAAADVNEHSEVRANGGVLETRSYRYKMSTLLKSRERSIEVDAASGQIVTHDKKGEQQFPMQPGVLDRQSVTLAIAQDLAMGKRGTLNYNVADSDRVGAQRYQVGKEETVHVPAGALRTITVARLRDSGGGRTTVSWFGLDNGFVPVKIVQTEPSGEVLEMALVSLRK
jgi:hypothetical protein